MLCLATKFPAQQETRTGRAASGTKPSASQSVIERLSLKRLLPRVLETCVKSGPFAPRALPRFLTTMSRSDSRPRPLTQLWIPLPRCGPHVPHHAGSPRTPCSSVDARPPHSPRQPDACICSLLPHRSQASASPEAWPLPLVSRGRIGFAIAGLTPSLSSLGSDSPGDPPPDRSVSRRQLPFDAGPELHVERAIHMADTSQSEQRSQRRITEEATRPPAPRERAAP